MTRSEDMDVEDANPGRQVFDGGELETSQPGSVDPGTWLTGQIYRGHSPQNDPPISSDTSDNMGSNFNGMMPSNHLTELGSIQALGTQSPSATDQALPPRTRLERLVQVVKAARHRRGLNASHVATAIGPPDGIVLGALRQESTLTHSGINVLASASSQEVLCHGPDTFNTDFDKSYDYQNVESAAESAATARQDIYSGPEDSPAGNESQQTESGSIQAAEHGPPYRILSQQTHESPSGGNSSRPHTIDIIGPLSHQTAPSKRRRTSDQKLTFACPYTKKDPVSHRDCYKYKLTRIRDVKQHLARCHRNPPYCPRCMGTFQTEDQRDIHVRNSLCPMQPSIRLDGITDKQRLELAKKSASNTSVEAQWFAVFDILFPGHNPKPRSPYIDSELLQDIALYQDFVISDGPRILSSLLTQRGAVTWNLPDGEQNLAAFQRTIFEEGLRLVFDQWHIRRSSNSQSRNFHSIPRRTGLDTPPSSSTSRERVGSTSVYESRAVSPEMMTSLHSAVPAGALPDAEDFLGWSPHHFSFGQQLERLPNLECENIDLQSGLSYDGSDDVLMRLVDDTLASSEFQPGLG